MKTSTRLLTLMAVAILAGYSTWTSIRIWQLEDRLDQLNRLQSERPIPPASSRVHYVFSDSFIEYFGERGVAEVERALEVSRRNPVFERTPTREADEFDLESLWESDWMGAPSLAAFNQECRPSMVFVSTSPPGRATGQPRHRGSNRKG